MWLEWVSIMSRRRRGRPPAVTPKQIREARLLLTDPEATVTAVAARYGVSRTTLYKGLNASTGSAG